MTKKYPAGTTCNRQAYHGDAPPRPPFSNVDERMGYHIHHGGLPVRCSGALRLRGRPLEA